jgi:flagellar hook-length control protein FliK
MKVTLNRTDKTNVTENKEADGEVSAPTNAFAELIANLLTVSMQTNPQSANQEEENTQDLPNIDELFQPVKSAKQEPAAENTTTLMEELNQDMTQTESVEKPTPKDVQFLMTQEMPVMDEKMVKSLPTAPDMPIEKKENLLNELEKPVTKAVENPEMKSLENPSASVLLQTREANIPNKVLPYEKTKFAELEMDQAVSATEVVPIFQSSQDKPKETSPLAATQNSTTVFSLQNNRAVYASNEKNKYVDALVQLGGMFNANVARNITNNEVAMGAVETAPQLHYEEIQNKLNQEYDLKIELLPPSADALKQESYNARIKIYPPELGEVLARLKVNKNSAELMIQTEHARVKEIIEANLFKLRENFQHSDIQLTHVQVDVNTSQSGMQHKSGQNQSLADEAQGQGREAADLNTQSGLNKKSSKRVDSLVDTYA